MFDITERRQSEEEKDRLEAELRHAHKMEAIGRLAGGVAHDFNNMLSVINGYTELAQAAPPGSDIRPNLAAILEAGQRSAELTRKLLAFARKQTIAPQVLDLNQTVGGMLNMLKRLIGENIEVVWRPGEDLHAVHVDPAQIDQVLINLVINARDAIATTGVITISTEKFGLARTDDPPLPGMPPGDYLRLSVGDDGRGMKKDLLPHVFEPFFTTKATGEGTGLGLATVHGIAMQNGGFVSVSSVEEEGTVFRLYLPGHEREDTPGPAPSPAARLPAGGETLLLVEDEPSILKLAQLHLRNLGYEVLATDSPTAAIRLANEFQGRISLLVTDVIMPEMNGHELWLHLNERDGLKRLYMSGYTADHIQARGILLEHIHFLQKPFTLDALTAKVREAIGGEPRHSD